MHPSYQSHSRNERKGHPSLQTRNGPPGWTVRHCVVVSAFWITVFVIVTYKW